MRRLLHELLAAVLLAAAGAALAQAPPAAKPSPSDKESSPEKLTPEEMLSQALRHNPDVRVAEAKLREAEAELNRTRLAVVQKVLTLQTALDTARKTAAEAEQRFKRLQQMRGRATVTDVVVDDAALALAQAKAQVAKLEAEVPYLLGRGPGPDFRAQLFDLSADDVLRSHRVIDFTPSGASRSGPRPAAIPTAVEDKLRALLDTPVEIKVPEGPFADVLELLQERVPGLTIRNTMHYRGKLGNPTVRLGVQERLPLRAVLQMLEDEFPEPGVRFVVREYGILVVPPDAVPAGALLLEEFLHGDRRAARNTPPSGKNPPAEKVDGLVKQVDAATGLVTISIGSDAGLQKGHTLEVFRLKPQPAYLGTLTVVEVQPREAIGRIKGGKYSVQPGDHAASRLPD